MITLVLSLLCGGGAGALTGLLIVKNSNNAQRPAQFPQQGFAPQPPQQQYLPQQFPPQPGYGPPPGPQTPQ